jgi:drug/metabolite transporter (DMT)-like permease
MPFVSAVVLSFGPVLVAILAAALILPRAWLATYAVFVIAAIVIYAGYSGQHDDDGLGRVFSTLFGMLMAATLAAGLITRWALRSRPPQAK